ncbi:hypothetical protein [Alteriqipengyuania sp. 357]
MRPHGLWVVAALFAVGPIHAQDLPREAPRGHPPGFFAGPDRFEPGPFVIFFDPGETEVSSGADPILDNAFGYWPETTRPRFVLCYDPAGEGEAGATLEQARMAEVRAQLLKRGALQVLYSTWDCYAGHRSFDHDLARIAMVGVLDPVDSHLPSH